MSWQIWLVFYCLYLIYEVIRVVYECKRDQLTFREWCKTPVKKDDDHKFDA